MTAKPITSGQSKQIRRFVEDATNSALEELAFDKDAAQRVIEQGNEIEALVLDMLRGLAVTDEFSNEEVASSYGYLSGYKPRPVSEQMAALKAIFPGLKSFDKSTAAKELPPGAEGMFLIPRWETLAPTYGQAVEVVLAKLAESRNGKFVNYRENQLGPNQLKESTKKAAMFQKLGDQQKGHDVLVVAGQFGIRHRGKSVRRARVVMGGLECGLGAFEIGIMLLTHPERLQHYDDLWVDCAGDEYAPDAGGGFYGAPYFRFYDEYLEFDADDVGNPGDYDGSASAVLPSECQS